MKHPTLRFKNGRRTRALHLLLAANEPEGLREPWTHGFRWDCYTLRNLIHRLCADGWVEPRTSGPRGGKRWHCTEVGAALAIAAETSPETYRSLYALLYK
jgi:hypothetical protein